MHTYIVTKDRSPQGQYCQRKKKPDIGQPDENGNEEYVYMFPKCLQVTADSPKGQAVHATLGGTFIPITKPLTIAEYEALDSYEFEKLIERNNQFFWGKKALN